MYLKYIPDEYKGMFEDSCSFKLCRIVSQSKGQYGVLTKTGEALAAVSGRFAFDAVSPSDYPAVGDYAVIDTEGGASIIQRVLPRKSVFLRRAAGTGMTEQVVAANIDTVFVCMSLNEDFNTRRLERYASAVWDGGAVPVVVLTKADLCRNNEDRLLQAQASAPGADVITTCAICGSNAGYMSLMPYLSAGKTAAFTGSSGAGKSTLINCLLGEKRQDTNSLRRDGRGKHTTTRRELMYLTNGAAVIDTPGMRELGVWDACAGIDSTFADIKELACTCRFKNCTHGNEPGCAVRNAIERGELSAERLEAYKKLLIENAYTNCSEKYIAEKKRKFKNIAKQNKMNRKR